MWVQIGLHGAFYVFFLLGHTLFECLRVSTRHGILRFLKGRPQVGLKLDLCGIMTVATLFVLVIVLKECMCVKQHLVKDEDECVPEEDQKFR